MTGQLREVFHDLADRPVAPPPPPSATLWRRGRRRRRSRQLAAGLAVMAVMVAGGSWWTGGGPLSAELGPVHRPVDGPPASLQAPSALHRPDAWTRSVDGAGAPGPLAVVARTKNRDFWLRSTERWFGVTGAGQKYYWLDLPGLAEDVHGSVALSPDGRYLGYHLGGEPTGAVTQSDIVGLAVYDTVTGAVTERRIPTRHGLSVDFDDSLLWSADSTYLVAAYGQYRRQMGSSSFPVTESWRPDTGAVRQLGALGGLSTESPLHPWDVRLWTWIDGGMVGVDPRDGSVRELEGPRVRSRGMVPDPPVLNQDGTRLVYLGSTRRRGGNFTTLITATVAEDGKVGRHVPLGSPWQPQQVLGWVDDRTAMVRARRFPPAATSGLQSLLAWDVVDGSLRQAMRLDEVVDGDLQLAEEATRQPFVDGRSWRVPAPPMLVVLVGLGGLLGVLIVRRRRRTSAAGAGDRARAAE